MSQIDDRIVALEFDNKQFESGAKQSLQTIEELKKSMKFDDMGKNLTDFSKNATKNFDLSKIQSGIDTLKDRFSATGIAGMEVIKRLTNFAIDSGKAIAHTLAKPFDIMWEGGWSRAANIENAKFQIEGLGIAFSDLEQNINDAVAGTAYGFDAAAMAASQLSASGVKAGEDMGKALRAISGVASMTNSQYEEISPIFTTVAGQGKLMTMQLRQLEARGLNAAAELGKALDKTEQEVRDMVTKGKIDFKTFADAMDNAFGAHATESNKTFSGALGNMQFALKKIGAEFAGPIRQAAIPFFNKVRETINEIKNNMTGLFPVFKDLAYMISNVLTRAVGKVQVFLKNDFTGAQNIVNGFKNIIQTVVRLMAVFSTAFKEVFGSSKSVGESINSAAEGFERLTEALIPSNETATIMKNVLVALLTTIKNVYYSIKPILLIVGKVAGGLFKIIGVVVSLIAKFVSLATVLITNSKWFKAIEQSGGLLMFVFEKLVGWFNKFKAVLSDNTTFIGKFASGLKNAAVTIGSILAGGIFTVIFKLIEMFKYVKDNFPSIIDSIKTKFIDFIEKLKEIPVFAKAFENIKMVISFIKVGISGLISLFKSLFSSITGGSTRARSAMSPLEIGMNILLTIGEKLTIVFKILGVVAMAALTGVASVFNTIMSVVRNINLDSVINKIKELVSRIKDLNIIKTAVDAFRSSGGNLLVTLQAVIGKIKEFFDGIRNSGTSVFDFFIEKIKNVISAIKDFFSSFGSKDGGDNLTRSIEAKASVLDMLKNKFVKVKDVVSNVLAKIRDEGWLTKVLMVAYVLAILKALIQIPSSIHKVSKSLIGEEGLFTSFKNIALGISDFTKELSGGVRSGKGLLESLSSAVLDWGKAQRKSKIELLGGLLRDIAIAIGILAGSLALLTLVDTDKLEEVAWILGIFSGVLIAIAGAVTYASGTQLVKDTWFSSFAANMLAMTISIGILGGLLLAFSKIEITDIKSSIGILVATLALMVVFGKVMKNMAGMDFSGATLRSAIFMIAFALSIKSLAKTLKELSDIEIKNPDSFIMSVVGLFGGMAVMVGAASAITPASALAVVALVWAISKVFESFKGLITQISSADIVSVLEVAKNQITIMVGIVSAMVTAITIASLVISAKLAVAGAAIGKGLLQVGAAFLLFGLGLLLIQSAIKKIQKLQLSPDDLNNIGEILVGILGSFAIVLLLNKVLGGIDTAILKLAGSIALLSIAMFNVAVVAHIVKNLEPEPIIKALGILITIMASMAIMVVAVKSGNGTLAFKTVLATVLGFTLLIGALIVLGLMCGNEKVFQDLLKGLALILGIMLGMSLVLMQVSKIHTGKSLGPILAMIGVLAAVFGALYLLSQNVHDTKDLIALGGIAAIILGTLWGLIALTKSLTKFAKENNLGKSKAVVKSLAALAVMLGGFIAVAAVLGGFAYLTKGIDVAEIGLKALAVIGTLYLLVLSAEKLTTLVKNVKMGDFGKMAIIMGAMVVALIAVAGAVAVVGMIPMGDDIIQKMLVVGLVLAELVVLSILMGKFGTASKGTFAALGSLAILTVIFGLLAAVCIALNMVPADNGTLAKSQTVMLVLAELVAINFVLGKIGAKTNALGAVGALCLIPLIAIFGLLALVCMALNAVPTEGFLAKSQTVMLVLLELIALNALLGLLIEAGGVAALGAVGALCLIPLIAIFGLLALVCAAINLIPNDDGLLAKTQIIMLVLTELIALTSLLGVLTLAAGVAELGAIGAICLIPLLGIFTLLALVCAAISLVPCEGMLEKTQTIILVLLELEGLLALLGAIAPLAATALVAIPGLLSVCLALISIAGVLKLLEGSSVGDMQATLDMLTGALWEIVGIGLAATAASIGLVSLGAAILMMGIACLAAGAGVLKFSEGINSLASTTPQQLSNLQNVIMTFCTTIAQGIVTIISQTGQAIIDAINAIIANVIAIIYGGASMLLSAGQDAGTSLYEGFKTKISEISTLPAEIIQTLISNIRSSISSLFSAGLEMGKSIVDGFRNGAMWHSPPVWEVSFFNDVATTAQSEGARSSRIFGETGKNLGDEIKNKFNETVSKWNFETIKKKGLDAVNNLTSGLKSGEGELIGEINFINGLMGQLAEAKNLAARGYSSSVGDYKYQQEMKRSRLIEQRNAIDYVNGTKAQRAEYVKLNDEIGKYDEKIKDAAKTMGMASDASAKLDLELNKNTESFGKAGGAAGGASKEMKSFQSDLEGVLEGQMNIFQKFEKKEAMSKDELLANMRSQIQGMTEWAAQMQTLAAKGLDQGLYQELAMMGPQGAEYVGAFAQMTAEELAEANNLWAQSLVLPKNVAGQVAGAFNGIGQNIMAGEAAGIAAGKGQAINEAVAAQNEITDQSKEAVGVQSPSTIFTEIGKFLMQGLANGIKAHGGEATTQVKKICSDIVSAARSQLNSSTFYSLGVNLLSGLAAGLSDEDSLGNIISKVHSIAAAIESAATGKKGADSHSPSRKTMRLGQYLIEGLALGMENNSYLAENAAESMASNTINSMRDTISEIGKMLIDEVDDPVITPVLDLSNVQEGMGTLSNMFSTTQALNASASLQNEQENGSSRIGNTTFIQNNYSPKALSRTEIYRQTKNQFSAYREAFS